MLVKIKYTKAFGFLLSLIFFVSLSTISNGQSTDLDKKLGAENAKLAEQQFGLYQKEDLLNYVTAIGNRLVSNIDENPFEFKFYLADDPIPNAFALPGGYVYVTRGLLSLIQTEDELACVMGHEIIHVIRRHSVKQMRSSVLPSLLEVPGNIVGSVISDDLGNLINVPISTSNNLLLSSYGRSQETEADTKGIALAAKSGYDPLAMGVFLTRLATAVEALTNEQEKKSYFDDHPYTPDRVNKINKMASKLIPVNAKPISSNPLEIIDGMTFGYNPAKGVFKENTFIQPNLNFKIVFPENWETTNQPTTVGAIHPDRQAAIFLGIVDAKLSPAEHARNFEQGFRKKNAKIPYRSETYDINGNSGHVFSVIDNSGSEPMYVYYLWLKMNHHMYNIIGIAPKIYEKDLDITAQSLRPVSQTEMNSIGENYISLVNVQMGESISELNNRTKNILSVKLTSILNGISEEEIPESRKLLKVVLRKKYVKE